jgi:hypothetical protein
LFFWQKVAEIFPEKKRPGVIRENRERVIQVDENDELKRRKTREFSPFLILF